MGARRQRDTGFPHARARTIFTVCLVLLRVHLAAASPSETVAVFGPPAGPPLDSANFTTSFELFGNGLYWWQGYGVCGEVPNNSEISFKGFASSDTTAAHPVFACSNVIEGVTRDDLRFYFAANRRLYTKAAWGLTGDPAQEIPTQYTPPPAGWDLGAMMLWQGRIYWTDYSGTSFRIRSVNPDGSDALHVRLGTGGKVLKILGYSYRVSNFAFKDAIFVLTADSRLTRCDMSPATNVVLATGVTDFDIREESANVFPNGFTSYTAVHVAQGEKYNVNQSSSPGTLAMINAASGTITPYYAASNQNQITSVALDTNNVYWTEQPVVCPPLFICSLGDYSLYRQSRPADHSHAPGTLDLIGLPGGDAGVNLRSDSKWIYFLNNTSIKRLPTDAAAISVDVVADGLEVVQAVQNMNSDVVLISNHPTYVRGYAHVVTSDTTRPNWISTALLHGLANGTEFPNSPIHPVKNIGLFVLSTNGVLALRDQRSDVKRAFLFELPSSWVQVSNVPVQLTFTMEVNPDMGIPETVPQASSNNIVSLSQSAKVIHGKITHVITAPLYCANGPIFYDFSPNFNLSFATTKLLLPFESFNLHPFMITDPLSDGNKPFPMDHPNTNTAEAAWGSAVDQLEGLNLWNDPFAGQDEHFLGMVHPLVPQSTGIAGMARRPGKGLAASMGRYYSGTIIAHEMSHNYGRRHINCGTFPPDQMDFDPMTFPCNLGDPNTMLVTATYGYDSYLGKVYRPDLTADIMSYTGPSWISGINWNILAGVPPPNNTTALHFKGPDDRGTPPTKSSSGQVMLLRGKIDSSVGAAQLHPLYLLPESAAPASVLAQSRLDSQAASRGPNPYFAEFLDGSGNSLAQIALAVQVDSDADAVFPRVGQYVDVPEGAQSAQIIQSSNILAQRFISSHSPALILGSPVLDNSARTLYLQWSASDADGDPLTFTIQYSSDNGTNWRALSSDYGNVEITLSTDLLPGGSQCRIRVIACDGLRTAMTTTSPFSIPKHAPRAMIEGVDQDQRLSFGSDARLYGLALDAEDGSKDIQLTWTLSGPTPMNSQRDALSLFPLSPGAYDATLTAVDTDQMASQAARHFEILPPLIPDGAAPTLDGIGNEDGYGEALDIPISLEDASTASARAFHSQNTLYLSFSNLKYGSSRTPRSVGLRVDPFALGGSPGPMDLGFFVDENGVPREEQGDGTNMSTTLSPLPGFAASIYRTPNSWSAEFAITDGLLMGWGHPAAIMIEHGQAHWPPLAQANQPASWAPIILGTNAPVAPNRAPVANAGPNQSFHPSSAQTIFLDGSASYDPDGSAVTYAWTQISGPTVALANTSSVAPSFVATPVANPTTLSFQLIVNDGDLSSPASTAQVTLLPPAAQPPVTNSIGGATLLPGDRLQVRLIGEPNQSYQILASTDLVSWQVLRTVYADYAGRIDFIEFMDSTAYPHRFFKAVSP